MLSVCVFQCERVFRRNCKGQTLPSKIETKVMGFLHFYIYLSIFWMYAWGKRAIKMKHIKTVWLWSWSRNRGVFLLLGPWFQFSPPQQASYLFLTKLSSHCLSLQFVRQMGISKLRKRHRSLRLEMSTTSFLQDVF